MDLEKQFQNAVARGWRPRVVAVGPELDNLQVSIARGDCIDPLVKAGDKLFLDPDMLAQDDDLVLFFLKSRGVAAQNSDLPAGQSPWKVGDPWVKYLAEDTVGGERLRFVCDRHGGVATLSLMAAEHPDDPVPLAVVRQIERDGKLLFGPTPDVHSAQLGANAATTVSYATTTNVSLPTGGVIVPVLGVTMGPFPVGVSVVVTASGYLLATNTSTTTQWTPFYYFSIIPSSATLLSPAPQFTGTPIPVSSSANYLFTYEQSFFQSGGTTFTFYLNMSAGNVLNSFETTSVSSMVLKAEAIAR